MGEAPLQSESPQERLEAPPGAGDGPTTSYGAAALVGESERVTEAQEGTRNNALNTAGLRMGQLARDGEVNLEDAQATLLDAA